MSETTSDVGTRQAVALVAGREITTRVRSKAYRISTVILLVGIVATILIAKATSGSTSAKKVGFLPQATASAAAFRSAAEAVGVKVTTPTITSRAEGEARLRSDKLDALVTGNTGGVQVEVKKDINVALHNTFNVLARQAALNAQLQKAGADPAAVSAAVASAKSTSTPCNASIRISRNVSPSASSLESWCISR